MRGPVERHRCRKSGKRLSHYLEDDLSRRQREALERHLQRCPRCQQMLASLTRVVGGLRHLNGQPPPVRRPAPSERS